MRPITLPPCLIEGAKRLFPTLDFSRIQFYYDRGAVNSVTRIWFSRTEIVLNGNSPNWPPGDPCDAATFLEICHELVHALQGQGLWGRIVHHAASWTCRILHGQGRGDQNCIEKEAHDYEQIVSAWLTQTRILPCKCTFGEQFGIAAQLAVTNPEFTSSVDAAVVAPPELIKRDAGCTPWECAKPGLLRFVAGTLVGTVAFVIAIPGSFVDGVGSIVGLVVSGIGGATVGAGIGAAILGTVGAALGFILGFVVGGIIGALIGDFVDWIISLFGDDGGALNLMFSSNRGLSFQQKVTFERSSEPMSLSFGGRPDNLARTGGLRRLAVSWTGLDSRVNLLTLPIVNPSLPKIAFEQSESCGPAITHMGVRIYILWQGRDNQLNGITTTNGVALANKFTLGTRSPDDASPAVCIVNGWMIMTYIGRDNHINILSSQNGIDWGRRITLGEEAEEQSTVAIAPARSNNFTIAWTGTDSDHRVNIMHGLSVDPTNGRLSAGTKIVLNERSAENAGPALASDGVDMLYLAWTGSDGSLNFMRSGDFGVTFAPKLTFERSRKDCGPALAVDTVSDPRTGKFSGEICIGWTGTG